MIVYEPVDGKIIRFDRYAIALSDLINDDRERLIKLLFKAGSIKPTLNIISISDNGNYRKRGHSSHYQSYLIKR